MTRSRGRSVRYARGGGESGLFVKHDQAGQMSPLHMLGSIGNTSWIYSGRVPHAYRVLGLTEEQTAAVEELCTAARQEQREMSKTLYANRTPGQRMDPEQMRERHRKFNEMREELADRFGKRLRDVLTEEQRQTLAKIEEVIEGWREEDEKIRQVMALALQKNRENHEEELEELLTEEQLEALQELRTNRPDGRRGAPRKGPPPPPRKPQGDPAARPNGHNAPVETF
jgi:hypothetical protein